MRCNGKSYFFVVMGKKDQPEIGTDVVFVTIVVLGRITGGV